MKEKKPTENIKNKFQIEKLNGTSNIDFQMKIEDC